MLRLIKVAGIAFLSASFYNVVVYGWVNWYNKNQNIDSESYTYRRHRYNNYYITFPIQNHHYYSSTSIASPFLSLLSSSSNQDDDSVINTSSSSNDADNIRVADIYKNQAEQVRMEIELLQQQRNEKNIQEQQKQQNEQEEMIKLRERYSVIVPILKPDGTTIMERCIFAPMIQNNTSYITTIESELPLGIIISEVTITDDNNTKSSKSYIVIDEISSNSYGELSGLQIGDIIHACTACKVDMVLPTWQLLLGGIGQPKTNRFMYSTIKSNKNSNIKEQQEPFGTNDLLENTINAISSNRYDPEQRPILLVIERREVMVEPIDDQ